MSTGALKNTIKDTGKHPGDEQSAESGSYPSPLFAWLMLAALFVAYVISFVDRMIIGLLVEPMKADLQLTDTQISLLHGAAFAIFYTIAGIPLGRLLDRVSRTRVVAAGIVVWSLMTIACGLVSRYGHLFLARVGVGAGEATLSPAAYSLISDSFPPRRLGLAMGIYSVASTMGAGLAFLLGAAVVSLVSQGEELVLPFFGSLRVWQAAFVIVGIPGLVIAPLFLLLRDPRPAATVEQPTVVPSISEVFRYCRGRAGLLLGAMFGVGCVNTCAYATLSWMPAFLGRGHGMSLTDAGYAVGVTVMIGGMVGYLGGGRLCDKLGGGPRVRLYFASVTAATGILFGVFPLLDNVTVALVLFTGAFAAMTAPTGAALTSLLQAMPSNMRATVSAVYVFVVNILGMTLGPTLTAVIGDSFFPQDDGIRYAIAIVTIGGFVGATLLFLMAARSIGRSSGTPV